MTIEELYELRKEVLENKTKFNDLNKKYNELLKKRYKKSLNKKEETKVLFIFKKSHYLYWIRFFVFFLIYLIFSLSSDILILFILINVTLNNYDDKIFLPKLWEKKKLKKKKKTKEDIEQEELYKRVSEARSLYYELIKKYEEKFKSLTLEEEKEYHEYLASLGVELELEESKGTTINQISSDVKLLNKAYSE